MKIALASPPFPESMNEGLYWLDKLVKNAVDKNAEIICFPESFLPGYPGMNHFSEDRSQERLQQALDTVCDIAAKNAITIIVPMDWHFTDGIYNLAFVISNKGKVIGYQTKNQLDPTEDNLWIPGTERSIFEVNGVKFGITICHEGFRYPESVRWAAQCGAQIVFHPHFVGSNTEGLVLREWGSKDNPYYEKAIMMRALENTIYLASANYASIYPESASAVISPHGVCLAHQRYGETGVIVVDVDLVQATGLLARRFKNELYR